ncbi:hypothetical protein L2Y96_08315 [Luteibacter aegosomaticola]|uniref:hypothetical protein n=1 Tax=Luteibacter aegosomaticola TaxID=2911538 RepID=UPI001FF7FFF6|nr:hypothetical protein [Luteibacter aegosomaticola]UPG91756.1 hypothetical protein L2Y96_08315 [Luteibacter aegosomaticola]
MNPKPLFARVAATVIRSALAYVALSVMAPPSSALSTKQAPGTQKPASGTSSQGQVDGFSGLLLTTPDADWQKAWATPSGTTPVIKTTSRVHVGEKLFVVILFGNPSLKDNTADVTCDIDVLRPDGTASVHETALPCYKDPIEGSPEQFFAARPGVAFIGESTDMPGTWVVRVVLHDNNRNVTLPLVTTFVLAKGS